MRGVTAPVVVMSLSKQNVLPPSRLHRSCQSSTVSVSGVSPHPLPRRNQGVEHRGPQTCTAGSTIVNLGSRAQSTQWHIWTHFLQRENKRYQKDSPKKRENSKKPNTGKATKLWVQEAFLNRFLEITATLFQSSLEIRKIS